MSSHAAVSVRWVYAALAAYALGLALYWPRVFLVVDEERYVSQAVAFARGGTTIPGADIVFPATHANVISNYPPGTSLLQTPFVWAFGWRGAVLLSLLALVTCTLVTARWLRDGGRHPAFALVIPGFLGAAFFGRIGMSDVPSAALAALVCYLLWRANRATPITSLLAGFCVGASVLFREPLIVLLAPLIAGAIVRRRIVIWAAVLGVVAGVALRLGLSQLLFGSALYVRDAGYGFSLASVRHTIPVFGFILLVLLPGGALLPFLYRGERRTEVVAAVLLYIATFMFFEYDSVRDNGTAKGVMLASRYMVPLLPLLALMAADVWPRLRARLTERDQVVASKLARGAAAAAVALAFAVHPLARRQETVPLAIVRGIYSNTSQSVPVITNSNATLKYLSPSYGPRLLVLRYDVNVDSVAAFARRFGKLSIALLDRSDSEMFRRESEGNARFLAEVRARCMLAEKYQAELGGWAHLRVFDLSGCRSR